MKRRAANSARSGAGGVRNPHARRLAPRVVTTIGREIDAIYVQMDDQLTRMAEIQLQFDRLRSKIRRLWPPRRIELP